MHAAFTGLMNRVFRPHVDRFVIVFNDDILIYSQSREEYDQHLSNALQTLHKEKVYAKLSKCELRLEMVAFLGHVILKMLFMLIRPE